MEDKIKNFEPVEEIVIDFGDICRFCLEDTNNAVRISDNCFSKDGKDLTIAKFVEKLTTIQILDLDGFPSLVCERCVNLIRACYDFIKICRQSQNELEKSYTDTLEQTKAELIAKEESNIVIDEFCSEVKQEIDEAIENNTVKEEASSPIHIQEIVSTEFEEHLESHCNSSDDHVQIKTSKVKNGETKLPVDSKNKEPYACRFCDKKYIFKNSLVSHIKKTHGDKLTESCNYCSKSFISKPELKSHLELEHKNLMVLCPYCSLHLKVQNLEDHLNEFHKLKWEFSPPKKVLVKESTSRGHLCQKCGKVLQTKRSYVNHQKLHTQTRKIIYEEKPKKEEVEKERKIFNCHLCEKTFKGKDTLNRHIRTHTGEKNFICEICSKGFYTKSEISRHVRYHRKDYRYICDICRKGFVDKTRFRHHIMAHKNVRPHKCPICEKEFILKGKMKIHMARRHCATMEFEKTPKGQIDESSYIPLDELLTC